MLNVPNSLTLLRIVLIPVVVLLLLRRQYGYTLSLLAVGGITDYFDGYIARHFHKRTRLGSVLDPMADKLLVNATFVTFAVQGILPSAFVVLVFLRDLYLALGALYLRVVKRQGFEVQPTMAGKTNTFLQILMMGLLTLDEAWAGVSLGAITRTLVLTVVALMLVSSYQYSKRGLEILRASRAAGVKP